MRSSLALKLVLSVDLILLFFVNRMSLLPSIFGFCLSNMNTNINHNAFLVIIFVLTQPSYLLGKTVSGVFNTYLAQAGRGQYVTSFAFHGELILLLSF